MEKELDLPKSCSLKEWLIGKNAASVSTKSTGHTERFNSMVAIVRLKQTFFDRVTMNSPLFILYLS